MLPFRWRTIEEMPRFSSPPRSLDAHSWRHYIEILKEKAPTSLTLDLDSTVMQPLSDEISFSLHRPSIFQRHVTTMLYNPIDLVEKNKNT